MTRSRWVSSVPIQASPRRRDRCSNRSTRILRSAIVAYGMRSRFQRPPAAPPVEPVPPELDVPALPLPVPPDPELVEPLPMDPLDMPEPLVARWIAALPGSRQMLPRCVVATSVPMKARAQNVSTSRFARVSGG